LDVNKSILKKIQAQSDDNKVGMNKQVELILRLFFYWLLKNFEVFAEEFKFRSLMMKILFL
jgi:hypothetical protein